MRIPTAVAKGTSPLKEVLANIDIGPIRVAIRHASTLACLVAISIRPTLGPICLTVPHIAGVAKGTPALRKEFAHLWHGSSCPTTTLPPGRGPQSPESLRCNCTFVPQNAA